jgi:cytochrome P450
MSDIARLSSVTPAEGRPAPSPRGRPLLGWALELQRDLLGVYEREMREHGGVVRLVAGSGPLAQEFYLLSDPDAIQQVLASKSRNYSVRLTAYQDFAHYFGDGIVSAEGDNWVRLRRIIQPLFTRRRVSAHTEMMAAEAAELVSRLRSNAAGDGTADINHEITQYALRVVSRLVFGRALGAIIDLLTETVPVILNHIQFRAVSPVRLPHSFPTPGNRRAERARRQLFDVVDRILSDRSRGLGSSADASADGREDMVSMLLAARDPDTGEGLRHSEICEELVIFLVAGHETVITALTTAVYLVGSDPVVQERIREEADSVLASRQPTADDMSRLTYTTMTIREAMRLYPPTPTVARVATAPDVVAGFDIPAGAMVVISPWAVHHNPEIWPDPYRFDPERFVAYDAGDRHRYSYLPFGGGPRRCIGEHFAIMEAAVGLSTIVRNLLVTSDTASIKITTTSTLRPVGEVRCGLAPRSAGSDAAG